MNSARHFALGFLGPIVMGALYCGLVGLLWEWLERHKISPLVTMLVGCVVVGIVTRRCIRNLVPVKCPFCFGKCYEIASRNNRFMCSVCGKDH